MKSVKLLCGLLFLLGLGISISAAAHGGGHFHHHHHGAHVGVVIGGPLWWPGYYSPYYVDPYPTIVTVPSQPTVYIEQSQDNNYSSSTAQANYWYHCSSPEGYYPYIKQCGTSWQRVSPSPPPPPQ